MADVISIVEDLRRCPAARGQPGTGHPQAGG
jgi:hypothetical protein